MSSTRVRCRGAVAWICRLLTRVPRRSSLRDFYYEAVDTKLSSVAKPKHTLQLAVYSRLLASVQEVMPEAMHIVVGAGSVVSVRTADLHYYSERAREGLEAFADALPSSSVGEPCAIVRITARRVRSSGHFCSRLSFNIDILNRIIG